MGKEKLILSEETIHEFAHGFCFELLGFLWDEENAFNKMKDILAKGNCPYKNQCKVYERTIKKHSAFQLKLSLRQKESIIISMKKQRLLSRLHIG